MRFFVQPIALALIMALGAGWAAAQEVLLAEYVADIGPEDHYNSSGTRLGTFGALLAQDRANFHRFGIRHPNDGWDPIFDSRAMRAQISDSVLRVPDYDAPYVRNVLDTPAGTYMVVYVYGVGERITRITIEVPG